jgi:hypothetical protein
MRKIGKQVGSKIYIHKDYAQTVVPIEKIANAIIISGVREDDYICIRYDKKTEEIAFQNSPDFDTADEPRVGITVAVSKDGEYRVTLPKRNNPQIWHHKWMWVGDDYTGFDVEASKARSELWEPYVKKDEKSRIGYLNYWNEIRSRWE